MVRRNLEAHRPQSGREAGACTLKPAVDDDALAKPLQEDFELVNAYRVDFEVIP